LIRTYSYSSPSGYQIKVRTLKAKYRLDFDDK